MKFLDLYEDGVIDEKIVAEIKFKFGSKKQMNKREESAVYEFLESIGGFFHILELTCDHLAGYFSETFIVASLASKLFLTRKSPET